MRAGCLLLLVAGACPPVIADELDLSFNSDALRGQYMRPFGGRGLQADAGWLYHQDNGDVAHLGLHLTGAASSGSDPVLGGLGLRLAYTDGDISDQDGFALALGGFLRYAFPRYDRVAVSAHAYFAPDVSSLGETEQYHDYMVRVSYNLLREADVYVGARYVRAEYDSAPDVLYDTGLHFGISLRF